MQLIIAVSSHECETPQVKPVRKNVLHFKDELVRCPEELASNLCAQCLRKKHHERLEVNLVARDDLLDVPLSSAHSDAASLRGT